MGDMIGADIYPWVGLSTEDKPPKAIRGQKAIEYDTGLVYEWRGDEKGNGGWVLPSYDVNMQDQTTRPIIVKFNQVTNSTTLFSTAVKGLSQIAVDNATGFSAGKYAIVFDPASENFSFYEITAVAGVTITLDTPVDYAYPAGSYVDVAITNMNVDGSGTAEVFGLRGTGAPPGVDITVDVTRLIFYCVTTDAVDLTTFGDIENGLSKGLVLRKRDGTVQNIFNVKTNGGLANLMYDFSVAAATNPVQGENGFVCRLTFAGQNKIGVAIRLPIGEDLEVLIQDDIDSLLKLEIIAEGHIVQ